MVKFRFEFTEEDMVAFFRRHDFVVTDVAFTRYVPVYHNREAEESFTSKCIVNPHTRKSIPVSVAFEKVILKVARTLLLNDIDKLTVLDALKEAPSNSPRGESKND